MEKAIVVERLTKVFEVKKKEPGLKKAVSILFSAKKDEVLALDNISFSIAKGELVGFIGPNGAGKTTTLKILSGVLYQTAGTALVNGFAPQERDPRFLRQMAFVMGQKNQLWWDLPAMDTLELNRAIYEIDDRIYKKSLDELVTLLNVQKLLTTQVRKLSLGQRMRLELVAALIHRPEVIFLDEPTIGLDVIAQKKMRDFIASYNRRHKATILLTSHNMDDVVSLAKRVIVIASGKIVFDGAIAELVSRFAKRKTIKVYLKNGISEKTLSKMENITSVKLPLVVFSVPREKTKIQASQILKKLPVEDLNIEEEPIEEIISQVFQ